MKNKVTEIRKSLQLNQSEFAKQLELSRSVVANIENGRTRLTEERKLLICKVFNVNKEWFRDSHLPMFKEAKQDKSELLALLIKYLQAC